VLLREGEKGKEMSDGARCGGIHIRERKNVIKNEIKGHIEKENDGENEKKRKSHKKGRVNEKGLDAN
jgi:hypothetical protein